MKKLFVLLLVAVAATGCCGRNKKTAETAGVDHETPIHNARISLDFVGTYNGTVPVTNAPGLEITLTLLTDSTFTFNSHYLERPVDYDMRQTSTFSWDDSGNNITLHNLPEGVNRYRVEENRLRMTDAEFNLKGGDKVDKFILNKVVEEPAADATDAADAENLK